MTNSAGNAQMDKLAAQFGQIEKRVRLLENLLAAERDHRRMVLKKIERLLILEVLL